MIIAGVGGQGVNSLAHVFAVYCQELGYECQYTVHKGGAQSLGSVYAEFRISKGPLPHLGQGIPKGYLDKLIALDPWETLRHAVLSHHKTELWVESHTMPLFTERDCIDRSNQENIDKQTETPHEQLNKSSLNIIWRKYREQAEEQAGTVKMANYFAGLDCIKALKIDNVIDNNKLFDQLFFAHINKHSNKAKQLNVI